ncbi:MAG: hypothetical protein IPK82_34805 [Polyangiaceae bacterium]|nr:hypothetical protein [Polyangiaceae bacterium]
MSTQQQLRVDAQALTWYQLAGTQRDAVVRLLEMLEDATEHANDGEDVQRSRFLSISGARGTGKTTALLTARNYCMQKFQKQGPGKLPETPDEPTAEAKKQWDTAHKLFQSVGEHLFWLPALQMDPLPRDTNLVGSVFARIRYAADEALNHGGSRCRSRGTQLDARNEMEEVYHRLDTLETEAIAAFDGNLGLRAPHLDAEVFSTVAAENEEIKLRFRRRLNAVLGDLAHQIGNDRDHTVFVLPVDDFDTSPARAVELMKLLYSLSVPRLFVVYLGAIDVADKMLYFEIQKQFRDLLGGMETADSVAKDEIAAAANEIASTSLRKMLPPSQRVVLEALPLDEALNYQPRTARHESNEPNIKALLDQITIRTSGLPTIKERLSAQVASPAQEEDPEASLWDLFQTRLHKHPVYQAADILRAPTRQVADLWLALPRPQETTGTNKSEGAQSGNAPNDLAALLIHKVVETVSTLIDEDARLDVSAQKALRRAILPSREGSDNNTTPEWELHPSDLLVRPQFGDVLSLDVLENAGSAKGAKEAPDQTKEVFNYREVFDRKIQARRVRKLDLMIRDPQKDPNKNETTVSDRTRAAVVFLHDLLIMTESGVVAGELRDDGLHERAYCQWSDGLSDGFQVPWNIRSWCTFWHGDVATAVWNQTERLTRRILREPAQMGANDAVLLLAYGWMAGGVAALLSYENEHVKNAIEPLFKEKPTKDSAGGWTWTALGLDSRWPHLQEAIDEVIKLAEKRRTDQRDDRYTDELDAWLVSLACLWMPECGIPWDHVPTPPTVGTKVPPATPPEAEAAAANVDSNANQTKSTQDAGSTETSSDPPWKAMITSVLRNAHHKSRIGETVWQRLARKIKRERLKRLQHFAATPLALVLLNPEWATKWLEPPKTSGAGRRRSPKPNPPKGARDFSALRKEYLNNLGQALLGADAIPIRPFCPDEYGLLAVIESARTTRPADIHPADLAEVQTWLEQKAL